MRRIPKLLLVCALLTASSFNSCEQKRTEPTTTREPRKVEEPFDVFVREDPPVLPKTEQSFEYTPPEVLPPERGRVAAKLPPAWLERALAESRAEVPLPAQPPSPNLEPTPNFEPTRPPPAIPPKVPPATKPPGERPQQPPFAEPDRRLTTATNVALGIGILGVGMGAVTAGSADGTPGERVMAVSWLGIGVASFATAGILYAVDSNPRKGVTFTAAPGAVGLRGRF